MAENQLGRETSPYLLQHQDNPVHWRAWSPAALAEAAASDKPVLLSIGYAACHWCHVMAHESFENPGIAALINQSFIAIKVDREERPDLDAIYQQALMLLGEQGGWPLTMFLTARGEPFWGGTYFPPASRWGRPGFPEVLQGIARIYAAEKDKVATNIRALTDGLAKLSQPRAAGPVALSDLDPIIERFAQAIDRRYGGIGQAPKFPNCSILTLIWRGGQRTDRRDWRTAVTISLNAMCNGGIYDHLGGGFARYSTDERWLAPHFEKMLYDNAQLVELLTEVWLTTKDPLYQQRVDETISWLLRDMLAPGGGFASTFDADSEHEEGKFYVWTEEEINRCLGPDAGLFKGHYDVAAAGNWEGKTILNRLTAPNLADAATEARLAHCRALLFDLRAGRIMPDRDDKVLADWNGLMIAALTRAALAFDRPDWLAAGEAAFQFVISVMTDSHGRLAHSWRAGRSHPGTLDDHADMARAALLLYESTGKQLYLDRATFWVDILDRHFADAAGGYFFTADDTEALITRTKSAADNAVPAGNAVMIEVLARLHLLTGDAKYLVRAETSIATFAGEIERNFFPLGTYLNGIDFLARAAHVIIIGAPDATDTKELAVAAHTAGDAAILVQIVASSQGLPEGHPAKDKSRLGDAATAYLCRGQSCSAPLIDPHLLTTTLVRA
ncbi:MAG: thioredoxin domain-containing protein [Aliidongia sp.]